MATPLKAIGQLKGYSFTVPCYQRGYRWTKREVETLLNDLWEFSKEKEDEYYCLQPIVVKRPNENENKYILIDGQQRLTTIYLIFKYFGWDEPFKIDYETREKSQEFLENIRDKKESEALSNPDFYYMWKAYKAIENWMKEKWNNEVKGTMDEDTFKDHFKILKKFHLQNDDKDISKNVRVIFYKLKDEKDKNDNGIEVFTRLNSGKVPLTDAELIRASLLLYQSDDRRIVAKEWDDINIELQDNSFWYFLSNKDYDSRIDLIFEVFLGKERDELYGLFEEFEKKLSKNKPEKLWEKIKFAYYILQYWYENDILYHLIGFLIASDHKVKLNALYKDLSQKSRTEVLKSIREKIKQEQNLKVEGKTLKIGNKEIERLSYDEDKKIIDKLLLFYNILLILNQVQIDRTEDNSTLFQKLCRGMLSESQSIWYRFPFELYKREDWSLEHIHAINAEDIREKDREDWLKRNREFLEKLKNNDNEEKINDVLNRMDSFKSELDKGEREKLFKDLQQDILNVLSGLKGDEIHSLGNLTLLTIRDNSALNNQTFAAKRNELIKWDKEGKFIPMGTKNVFLKYYSEDVKDPYLWRSEDAKAYVNDIKGKFESFFGGNEENE